MDICIVAHLKKYLSLTQSLRGSVEQLQITLNKPHKGVTTDTIACWLKLIMTSSGVYSPHSTRAASVSQASRCSASINTFLAAGGWYRSNAKTFVTYYNKPLNDNAFASTIYESNSVSN